MYTLIPGCKSLKQLLELLLEQCLDEDFQQETNQEFKQDLELMPESDRSIVLRFLGSEENAQKCYSSSITLFHQDEVSETNPEDSLMQCGDDFWIIKITEDSLAIFRKTTTLSSATIQGITRNTLQSLSKLLIIVKEL